MAEIYDRKTESYDLRTEDKPFIINELPIYTIFSLYTII